MDIPTIENAVKAINMDGGIKVDLGIILGSGLGKIIDWIENPKIFEFGTIPGFVKTTAPSHIGRLILGQFKGVNICLMQGRLHLYEGYSPDQIAFPINVMKRLGAENLVLTNAAGALNSEFNPGDIMLINDHINLTGENPLIGENNEALGPRFPDMSKAYDSQLLFKSREILGNKKIEFREGIYIGIKGPSLETSAERRFFRVAGGDVVGMSTVLETITAVHVGMKVLGISAITNSATGGPEQEPDTMEDILWYADVASKKILSLLQDLITEIN